jgi:hypothetical protein
MAGYSGHPRSIRLENDRRQPAQLARVPFRETTMSRSPAESPASGIAYTLSFADFLAVRRALAWNRVFGPATYWIRFAFIGVLLLACWTVPIMVELKAHAFANWRTLTVAAVLAGVVAYTIAMLAIDLLVARMAFGRLALANAKVSLQFGPDGVHYQTPSTSGVLLWSGIRRVITPPGYLLLCISKSEALTLPRRAFASDTAFDDTLQHALARIGTGATR